MILIVVGAAKVRLSQTGDESDYATFEVKRGPLTISVIESGTIKAREQLIIKNEVEGRTSIISLIPEGTHVKKGDLMVELDASTLEDGKIDQEIQVQNAEAAYINAKENLAVVENQAASDVQLAELTLEFARLDLKKYINGEYPNELKQAQTDITLAEASLTNARETLQWSQKLYDEKYISEMEFQADKIDEQKCALDLELAKNNLALLTDYTYQRNLTQFRSDVNQAEMALERTRRKASADVVQAKAELTAKQAEYQRQVDKLKKIEDQIEKTSIYAPADGLVIYATSARRGGWRSSTEPLEEGQEVRERQELIYLPTGASANAEIDIHEANLEKVAVGLPAVVTVTSSGKTFLGTVEQIAPLPDAQSMWMNPDLKVYNTEIYLQGEDPSLRTGMSCQAEIVVAQYDNVLYVPVQAVVRVNEQPTVYVKDGKAIEPQAVGIGLDNNRMIHIISGLEEGQTVLLNPPLKAAAVQARAADAIAEQALLQNPDVIARLKQLPQAASSDEAASEDAPAMPRRTDPADRPGGQGAQGRRRFENLSPEEREKMRERFESMSPEQRQQMRRRTRGTSNENQESISESRGR